MDWQGWKGRTPVVFVDSDNFGGEKSPFGYSCMLLNNTSLGCPLDFELFSLYSKDW